MKHDEAMSDEAVALIFATLARESRRFADSVGDPRRNFERTSERSRDVHRVRGRIKEYCIFRRGMSGPNRGLFPWTFLFLKHCEITVEKGSLRDDARVI